VAADEHISLLWSDAVLFGNVAINISLLWSKAVLYDNIAINISPLWSEAAFYDKVAINISLLWSKESIKRSREFFKCGRVQSMVTKISKTSSRRFPACPKSVGLRCW
jgi:hypothetical protein